jgi:hypothetical protein
MNALQRGLLFAALQVAMVSSLGAKLLWDRGHLPRGWAETRGYDPNLIIRGRYTKISLLVKADRVFPGPDAASSRTAPFNRGYGGRNVYLTVENGKVVANPTDQQTGLSVSWLEWRDGEKLAVLNPPVAFFLPEHAADPTRIPRADTLFLEVTVPKKGPPRPIRFGRNVNGAFTMIDIE